MSATYFLTDDDDHAKRSYTLHKEMKKYHPILTGADDIPISVFITRNEERNSIDTAKLINTYYTELTHNFSKEKRYSYYRNCSYYLSGLRCKLSTVRKPIKS